jgi:transcriptional regulator with XRE-family HTH domain
LKLPGLREVRELRGWSQDVLAKKADVSRDSISNYETGQRKAYPSTAKKLADALNVSVSELEKGVDWGAHNIELAAKDLDSLTKVAKNAKKSLDAGHIEYTARFLELLDEGLQLATEHLYEWLQVQRGGREKTEENIDDKLSELMREWQAEKA